MIMINDNDNDYTSGAGIVDINFSYSSTLQPMTNRLHICSFLSKTKLLELYFLICCKIIVCHQIITDSELVFGASPTHGHRSEAVPVTNDGSLNLELDLRVEE